ncbi:MAG: VWA domain-containing protein [Bacteroidaceae bacterium]|nr:VWA domain-containing protein [Bacteroidaceae bacterium]
MFKFANPNALFLYILLLLVVGIYFYAGHRRKSALRKYGDPNLLAALMPEVSPYRSKIKFWITFVAMCFMVLLIARPQFGTKVETVKRHGIETIIALDISNSMLAEDVAPNRLEKSKNIISKLVDSFEDDKVGLIVFAGDAFIQLPITNDFISAKMFLESINPGLITRQGTNIKAAIDMATRSFTPREGVGKAVIIITDGENHEGGAIEAAKAAAEKGLSVYVMGVGSLSGAPIPGNRANDFRRDKEGNVIVTKLNEQMCQEIAAAGNGVYIRIDNTNNAQKLLQKEIDKLAKADIESAVYSEYDEQFQVMAWIALILLLLEMLLMAKKNPRFKNINLFG